MSGEANRRTGTPWTVVQALNPDNTGGVDFAINDEQGKIIAEVFNHVGYGNKGSFDVRPAEANARYIVQCVNSHNQLVEAAKGVIAAHADTAGLDFAGWCQILRERIEVLESALEQASS